MMNLFLAMLIGNFERATLTAQVKQVQNKLNSLAPSIIPTNRTVPEKMNNETT